MAARKSLDLRPGPLPEITAEGNSVTFHLPIPRARDAGRLIIRCDADGQVWAAICDDRTPWQADTSTKNPRSGRL
jgi:hypothetical protein